MKINYLQLKNFKRFTDLEIENIPETSKLVMLVGPNGSGKSTFKSIIRPELLGVFINPDEIEQEIQNYDFLDLRKYRIDTTEKEILEYPTHAHVCGWGSPCGFCRLSGIFCR